MRASSGKTTLTAMAACNMAKAVFTQDNGVVTSALVLEDITYQMAQLILEDFRMTCPMALARSPDLTVVDMMASGSKEESMAMVS